MNKGHNLWLLCYLPQDQAGTSYPVPSILQKEWATGYLTAVQTINHWQWEVDYDPLSVLLLRLREYRTQEKKVQHSFTWMPLSESWIKYCCFTAQQSRRELCFVVTDIEHQTPTWRQYPIGLRHTDPLWPSLKHWCCIIKDVWDCFGYRTNK